MTEKDLAKTDEESLASGDAASSVENSPSATPARVTPAREKRKAAEDAEEGMKKQKVETTSGDAAPVKRGRGRPRKLVNGKPVEKPEATGPKRGRGRPRKNPVEEPAATPAKKTTAAAAKASKESKEETETPKRRGRPPKKTA